jgi:predicted metal-dependent peptidase
VSDDLGGWLRSFVAEPRFLARYPLHAGVLARLTPVADPGVGVMAVSLVNGRFYLHVNVEYFARHPQYLLGVLLHEIHHVALGHLTHPKFRDAAHPDAMELAIEISANEHIEEPLPQGVFLRDYERFGLRPGQSTIQRYEMLIALAESGKVQPSQHGPFTDDHLPSRPQGNALEQTRQVLREAVAEARQQGADEQRMRIAGKLPGRLLEMLDDEGAPNAPIDWKTALRMFAARRRAPRHTYARPSRRFPGRIGEIPGRSYGTREVERPRLMVVIDTSGSMTPSDLAEVARQLRQLADHARFLIAECDVAVHRVYPFAGEIDSVMGRGGTDLRTVFLPSFRREHRFEGLLYFTDGIGPFPALDPGVATLWVLSGETPFGCTWGQQVRM